MRPRKSKISLHGNPNKKRDELMTRRSPRRFLPSISQRTTYQHDELLFVDVLLDVVAVLALVQEKVSKRYKQRVTSAFTFKAKRCEGW